MAELANSFTLSPPLGAPFCLLLDDELRRPYQSLDDGLGRLDGTLEIVGKKYRCPYISMQMGMARVFRQLLEQDDRFGEDVAGVREFQTKYAGGDLNAEDVESFAQAVFECFLPLPRYNFEGGFSVV